MATRQQKKIQTRNTLIKAVLDLVDEGGSFSSISIREITKQAGVVPTSFYRHFESTDQLGLNIVDEIGITLRKIIRSARQADFSGHRMMQESVDLFFDFVQGHKEQFRFMEQGRAGGSRAIRNAVRNELRFFSRELMSDLERLKLIPDMSSADLEMISDLVITTVHSRIIDYLDDADNPIRQQELRHKVVKQLRILFMGTSLWRT
ncbi:MAG: HTH-type transcriptional repressor FabR [Pseudomonadales bacterium]|nr:HTH-type transcriptional repressor FabR [Pseudomonadales bacterium]